MSPISSESSNGSLVPVFDAEVRPGRFSPPHPNVRHCVSGSDRMAVTRYEKFGPTTRQAIEALRATLARGDPDRPA